MDTFKELQDFVKKKGPKSSQYTNVNGEEVYLSRGIKEVFMVDFVEEQKIVNAVGRFQKKDYGNAADYGKEPRAGHEYGRYEIASFDDEEDYDDTAVWVHRVEDAIKVYFKFER